MTSSSPPSRSWLARLRRFWSRLTGRSRPAPPAAAGAGRIERIRHPLASLAQSLIEDVAVRLGHASGSEAPRLDSSHPAAAVAHRIAHHHHEGTEVPDEVPPDLEARHGGIAETLWTCAKLAAEILAAKFHGDHAKAQEKHDELKFSTCDPRWAEAVTEYLEYFGPEGGRRKIPYIEAPSMDAFVLETLPRNATVALLGDWGTGTADAIATLRAIRQHQPDVLIHLGDIYYSGTPRETDKFFLDIVNDVFERDKNAVAVYTMTGNHDMYDGGVGYYGLLPKLNPPPVFRPEQAQPASFLCLRSPGAAWQFLLMDTGLHDHDPFTVSTDITWLEPSEEAWHVDKIRRFAAAGGRTILLSHHQLFSGFDVIGGVKAKKPEGEEAANPKLLASLRRFQEAARAGGPHEIAAWFWGHEHNMEVYEPYLGLAKGRCIGHGAIPEFLETGPYDPNPHIPDPPQLVDDPRKPGQKLMLGPMDVVYAHGFVIVRLDDAEKTATASYYQETDYSRPMYVETL